MLDEHIMHIVSAYATKCAEIVGKERKKKCFVIKFVIEALKKGACFKMEAQGDH